MHSNVVTPFDITSFGHYNVDSGNDATLGERVMNAPALNLLGSTAVVAFNPAVQDKAIINAARDLYTRSVATLAAPFNEPSQLSDDAVWQFAVKYRAQYPNAADTELHGYMVKSMYEARDSDNGPEQADNKSPPDTRIANMVRVLNSDVEFKALVDAGLDARTIVKSMTREFTRILFADFCTVEKDGKQVPWYAGYTGNKFDMGTMAEWPEPGLVASEKITRPNTGWDVERKIVNGKNVPVSWYRTAIERFTAGERINAEIAEMALALQSPPSGKYKDNNSKEYIEGGIAAQKEQLGYLTDTLRDAVRLIRQLHAVNELGHVKAYLVVNRHRMADGSTRIEFTDAPNKVYVEETHEGGERWPCTIAQFMRFSPKIAATKGGTLSALRESAKPEESTGNGTNAGQGNTDQAVTAWTLPTFAIQAERFGQFMENDALMVALAAKINDKDETKSDPILVGLTDAFVSILALFAGHPDWVARSEKLRNFSAGQLAAMIDPKLAKKK
jgi:hypothetical protein